MSSQTNHTAKTLDADRHGASPADTPAGLSREGLSKKVLIALNVLAVGMAAALFWLAREPIHEALGWEETWQNSGDTQPVVVKSLGDDPDDVRGSQIGPETVPERERTVEPTTPALTLLGIVDAVATVDQRLVTLIGEGREEIVAFEDLTSPNSTRANRAQRRFKAWGRIWLNRLAVIDKALPPNADCAVHAAMDPACRGLRRILADLRQMPTLSSVEQARDALDTAALDIETLLRPVSEETEETVDGDVEGDESAPAAGDQPT